MRERREIKRKKKGASTIVDGAVSQAKAHKKSFRHRLKQATPTLSKASSLLQCRLQSTYPPMPQATSIEMPSSKCLRQFCTNPRCQVEPQCGLIERINERKKEDKEEEKEGINNYI